MPSDLTEPVVQQWSGGISWIADPEEDAKRASHALATDAGVWIVDPVDAADLDDHLADLGDVAGVAVLHDRHTRDATDVAQRHDVPVSVPEWMDLTREKLTGSVSAIGGSLPGSDYQIHALIDTDEWEEALLVDADGETVLIPEAFGTVDSFGEADTALGLHPALDDPPGDLDTWSPERILVGHGESILEDGAAKLSAAIDAG